MFFSPPNHASIRLILRQCAACLIPTHPVTPRIMQRPSSWCSAGFQEGLRLGSEMCFVCVLLKETGEEAQGDAEQHAAGDDGDGELYGQELR